jgi:lysozyme
MGSFVGRRLLEIVALATLVVVVLLVIDWQRHGVSRFPLRGIDVSHHQGQIDWEALTEADLRFVFIKATEGRDHLDTRFEQNWAGAERAGIARGAYHFFTFCTPGEEQARHFLEVVPPTPQTLPPAVDVEFAGNCKSWTSVDEIRRELRVFLEKVGEAWGRTPMLYITSESEDRIVYGHFDDYPIWIRNVIWRPRGGEPAWLFWQFTDDAELPGIDTPVDMNVYRGDEASLTELAGLAPAAPSPAD